MLEEIMNYLGVQEPFNGHAHLTASAEGKLTKLLNMLEDVGIIEDWDIDRIYELEGERWMID